MKTNETQLKFENFAIWVGDVFREDSPIMVAVRDRTDRSNWDETWTVASITQEEALKIYEYLYVVLSTYNEDVREG